MPLLRKNFKIVNPICFSHLLGVPENVLASMFLWLQSYKVWDSCYRSLKFPAYSNFFPFLKMFPPPPPPTPPFLKIGPKGAVATKSHNTPLYNHYCGCLYFFICRIFWGHLHFWVQFHFWNCLLKSPIFVIQKADAPKNGIEFCQKSIGALRCSLATSCDEWRRRATSMKLTGIGRQTGEHSE